MKNYKNLKNNNSGYTLVEMIIVLAIIAVLSMAAGISITLINSAKAKEASVTFDSEVATLITKSKNTVCTYDADSDGIAEMHEDYVHCLRVYKDGDIYYVMRGYYDVANDTYIFNSTTDSNNNGKGKSLTSYVRVTYTSTGGTEADIDDSGVIIRYGRNGGCIEGDGTYNFYKRNGNMVANVILRKNGSHELR